MNHPARNADVPVGIFGKTDEDVGAPGDIGAPEDLAAPKGIAVPGRGTLGWYSRGYLPHCDQPRLIQSITFRLADSLPQTKLRDLEEELHRLPDERRDSQRRLQIEAWLDAGMGCCALRHPAVAEQVWAAFKHFDGERYRLLEWCIMPNHVHVLVEAIAPLALMVQGWKSVTARWVLARNAELRLGIPDAHQLWMREYWDRFIRNEQHLRNTITYIRQNPVKAGLCGAPEQWPWSSAKEGELGTPTSPSAFSERPTRTSVLPGASLLRGTSVRPVHARHRPPPKKP